MAASNKNSKKKSETSASIQSGTGSKRKRSPSKPKSSSSSSVVSPKKKKSAADSSPTTGVAANAYISGGTLPPTHTLIVDNGGDTLKYGWITEDTLRPPLPNISARLIHQFTTLVGDELGNVQNPNNLIAHCRSTERGILTNLENQTRVWKRMLDLLGVTVPTTSEAAKVFGWNIVNQRKKGKQGLVTTDTVTSTIPSHTIAVILLLPPHCPRLLIDQMMHIWFGDFGVAHVGLANSTVCASYHQVQATPWKTSCTVDMGWSSTLIVPTFRDRPVQPTAIRRLPLGGRHMINMLKYYLSYRQYNLMDQTQLLREVFEKLSFLSLNLQKDLALARQKPSGRRWYDRDFVLPDYQQNHKGEIRIPLLLQRDMEREAQQAKEGKLDGEEEEEDEEDEDFEMEESDDDDEDDDMEAVDEDMVMIEEEDIGGTHKKKKNKHGRKKSKDKVDSEEEDDDEEEATIEQRRQQILQERAEEEKRRRQKQEEEQVLRLSLERFVVPEVLFRPMDAGLQPDLVGLAQAIVQSVQACPEPYQPALYQTIYLVGGVSQLRNVKLRLEGELRSLVPAEYEMKISIAESPIDRAWMGAKKQFVQSSHTVWSVSRREWEDSSKTKAYRKLLLGNGGSFL
ncbi:actin family [Nitzschia inconspicua]|uniref:Actin family n=1 Tax=Nitzschia inconspicua TaxID=303405 RepID=A0A9K3PU80_9STRA|nr:actin family [Nitzschia inconspicua]